MLHRRPWGAMADTGESGTDETARLEAALARIARARPQAADPSSAASPDRQALAARLDALIAELRSVLGRDSAD